jgi:hypothetical protein
VLAAIAAAHELPHLSLGDALELTLLIARKDPRRHLADADQQSADTAGQLAHGLSGLENASRLRSSCTNSVEAGAGG